MPKLKTRIEQDSLGEVEVPAEAYWGAQTQRSLHNFAVGDEIMPEPMITALAVIKKVAAQTNAELGKLSKTKAKWIIKAADEVIAGRFDDHFPLSVWQTGSGTQTNMNLNEVIANRASELSGAGKGKKRTIHPNDDVNRSQSSNDVFPTAMHIIVADAILNDLLPTLEAMKKVLQKKQKAFSHQLKISRTHLQDAVPMTVGQEFSAFMAQLEAGIKHIKQTVTFVLPLPIGGTAIGTGLNAPKNFDKLVVKKLVALTGIPFKIATNKFSLIASHDVLVMVSGALKSLATALMKMANDIRWLASGPRCGLDELILPENEPGSSIMPGKVNPTQCEAMMMVCTQVMGNDVTIGVANSQSNFQLNTFKPVIIHNLFQSIVLLDDVCFSFTEHILKGLTINKKQLQENLDRSLMLVTALTTHIGYDKAAEVAQYAHQHHLSLKEACIKLKVLTAKKFDQLVQPKKMV